MDGQAGTWWLLASCALHAAKSALLGHLPAPNVDVITSCNAFQSAIILRNTHISEAGPLARVTKHVNIALKNLHEMLLAGHVSAISRCIAYQIVSAFATITTV